MHTRRLILKSTAAVILADTSPIHAAPRYGLGDETWWTVGFPNSFRDSIITQLRNFFGRATGPFPISGDEGGRDYLIIDQFLRAFSGVPAPVGQLPDGRWLFVGAVPHSTQEVAIVVMSASQTIIDAAMMTYSLCPPGGVGYTDPGGTVHRIKCEIELGWAIFIPNNQVRDQGLIGEL